MIGKLVGAYFGSKAAQHSREVGGPAGAVLGVLATSVLARMSLPAMIVLGAAGYGAKKLIDKNEATKSGSAKAPAAAI